jgi:hypothetical protein
VRPLDEYRASRRGAEDDDDELGVDPAVTPTSPEVRPGMPGSPPFLPST